MTTIRRTAFTSALIASVWCTLTAGTPAAGQASIGATQPAGTSSSARLSKNDNSTLATAMPDRNVWPQDIATVVDASAPIWIWKTTGKYEVDISLNDNQPISGSHSSFNILIDEGLPTQQRVLKNITLTTTSMTGQNHIHFNYPEVIHSISVTGALQGMQDLFLQTVQIDGAPLCDFSPAGFDSRSSVADINHNYPLYNSGRSQHLVAKPCQVTTVGASASTVAAMPDMINGATINGSTSAPATLANLISATASNAKLILPANGVFHGTSDIPNAITLDCNGSTIDGTGIEPKFDKAGLVPNVSGVVARNCKLKNFAIDPALGGNAAGWRQAGDGVDFKLINSEISHSQNGLLLYPAHVIIKNSKIHDNGSGDGYTHNIYAANDSDALALKAILEIYDSTFANDNGAHEIKSRWATTILNNDDETTGGNGSCVDVSDGGSLTINGGSCTLPANANDKNALTYAMETTKMSAVPNGHLVKINNWKIVSPGVTPLIQTNDPKATLIITGSSYVGSAPKITGFANVSGAFVATAH